MVYPLQQYDDMLLAVMLPEPHFTAMADNAKVCQCMPLPHAYKLVSTAAVSALSKHARAAAITGEVSPRSATALWVQLAGIVRPAWQLHL